MEERLYPNVDLYIIEAGNCPADPVWSNVDNCLSSNTLSILNSTCRKALEGYLGYLRIPQYFWTNSMNFSKKFQSFMYLVCYTGYFYLHLTCGSNVAILLWQKNDLLVKLVLFAEKRNLITF